ncbi:hypothetical protein CEXT_688731 [Caerostris extrusa]|uniref:Uncharacterized protein n=1 Tax=Caerostris extrusa TaxID=172846 RepID=A0AAV4PTE4_CAEEX|nr:hypothetical protein CEXT_688731 [Caerostris extrusa]
MLRLERQRSIIVCLSTSVKNDPATVATSAGKSTRGVKFENRGGGKRNGCPPGSKRQNRSFGIPCSPINEQTCCDNL